MDVGRNTMQCDAIRCDADADAVGARSQVSDEVALLGLWAWLFVKREGGPREIDGGPERSRDDEVLLA